MSDFNLIHLINYTKESVVLLLQAAFGQYPTPARYQFITQAGGQVDPNSGIEIWRVWPKRIVKYPAIVVQSGAGRADLQFLGHKDYLSEEHVDATAATSTIIPENRQLQIANMNVNYPIYIVDASGNNYNYVYRDPTAQAFTLDQWANIIFSSANIGTKVNVSYMASSDYRKYGGLLYFPISITVLTMESVTDMEVITDLVVLYVRAVFREKFLEKNIVFKNIAIQGESSNVLYDGRVEYRNVVTIDVVTEYNHVVDISMFEFIRDIDLDVEVALQSEPVPPSVCYCTSPAPVITDIIWSRNSFQGFVYPTYVNNNLLIGGNFCIGRCLFPNCLGTDNLGSATNTYSNIYLSYGVDYLNGLQLNSTCFTVNGNLGLNKYPLYTLDVSGSFNVDGNLTVNNLYYNTPMANATHIKRGTQAERDALFTTLSGGELFYDLSLNVLSGYKPGVGWVILS